MITLQLNAAKGLANTAVKLMSVSADAPQEGLPGAMFFPGGGIRAAAASDGLVLEEVCYGDGEDKRQAEHE